MAACAQMVLHYLGMVREQTELGRQLGVRPGLGVPASRIKQLATNDIVVTYDVGEWKTIQQQVRHKAPVIAMIQAGELAHWRGESFQHAVVVAGFDTTQVWLLDPAASSNVMIVSVDEFMLAWDVENYIASRQKRGAYRDDIQLD